MPEVQNCALVTGGAKRVGREIALKLAGAGFDVAITYLSSQDEARDVVEQIESTGRRGLAIRADLSKPDSAAKEIYEAYVKTFSGLSVLVNNASLWLPGELRETTVDMVRKVNAIHVEAPLLLCQRFESMLRANNGHVVNMCDLLAERPWPEYLAYCASKAALVNLTLGLARSLAPDVTVNGIAPGVVEWPENYPDEEKRKYLQRVPLARAGTPADVARLVRFLVTEGSYITGQIIRLDGGRSIT
jgi:pteridine reductase